MSPQPEETETDSQVEEPPPAGGDEDRDLGTAGGNPLAGLIIDPADADAAVPGDEGPLNPGQR